MINHNEFITKYTRLQYLFHIPEIRLFLRDDNLLHSFLQQELGSDTAYPQWAYTWAGGIALAKHILENKEIVKNRHVIDYCSGSGIVGIVAAISGAASVTCVDNNELAISASLLNAKANKVSVNISSEMTEGDLILSGDPALKDLIFDKLKTYDDIYIGCPIRKENLVAGLQPIKCYDIINDEFPMGTKTYIWKKHNI
jgi:predicted nicotinamide N-methyase